MRVPTKAIWKVLTKLSVVCLESFYSKKFDSWSEVYKQRKNLTTYEMFIDEIFLEIFNQLQSKSSFTFWDKMDNQNLQDTRRSVKWIPITYSRTVTRSKSLKTTLRKGYNWLTSLDLLPPNLTTLSEYQTKRISSLFVTCTSKTARTWKTCFPIEFCFNVSCFFISLFKLTFLLAILFEVKNIIHVMINI